MHKTVPTSIPAQAQGAPAQAQSAPEKRRDMWIDSLHRNLAGRLPAGRPSGAPEAGVLIGVLSRPQPALVYTLRSAELSSHAGEVAFPGGKRETDDGDLWDTALRESNEEIGLQADGVQRIGQLDRSMSRFGIEVTPCVVLLDSPQQWHLSSEAEEIFTMPLEQLLYQPPLAMDTFTNKGETIRMPRWRSAEGWEIWGLTARITAEFLHLAYGDDRPLCDPPVGQS